MATWLVKAEIPIEADNRRDAWAKARKWAEELGGTVVSIPQVPEPKERDA